MRKRAWPHLASLAALGAIGAGCGAGETPDAAASPAPGDPADGGRSDVGVSSPSLPPVTCDGSFGPPKLVLEAPGGVSSVAVTADELELFFRRDEPTASGRPTELYVATRTSTSAAFELASARRLTELEAACEKDTRYHAIDVSQDGLRAYFQCVGPSYGIDAPRPLHFARRSDRKSPFVYVGPTGTVPFSTSIGVRETKVYAGQRELVVASRASTDSPFDPPEKVRGLESTSGSAPAISEDDLALFFGVSSGQKVAVFVSTRSTKSSPFGAPTPVGNIPFKHSGGVDVTSDCRAIYFSANDDDVPGPLRIYVMRR